MTQPLAWAWASHAPGLAEIPRLTTQIRQTWPLPSPWSEDTVDFVVQMRKACGWDYHPGSEVINGGCQDPCCRPLLSSLSRSDSQWSSPTDSSPPPQSLWGVIRGGAPAKLLTMPRGFVSHCRDQRLRGDLSLCCCAGLGMGKVSGQSVAVALTLRWWSVLLSVVQEGASASPRVLGFSCDASFLNSYAFFL